MRTLLIRNVSSLLCKCLSLLLILILPGVPETVQAADGNFYQLDFTRSNQNPTTLLDMPTGLTPALQGTTYFGGTVWAADSMRWEAIQGSCWTFDSGVGSHFDHSAPFVDPGKDPSLHALMEGWIGVDRSPAENPGGEWSNLADLTDLPPPLTPCICSHEDSVLVFEDLTVAGHGLFQDNIAVSPWIDLLAAGVVGSPEKFIETDLYTELPLLNYVFIQFLAQWYPEADLATGTLVTSPLTSNNLLYYTNGTPHCTSPGTPIRVDFSYVIPPEAEQVRIAVGVVNLCRFFANCTGVSNVTPWFDNIKFGVTGDPTRPALATIPVDRPQDSFPQDGTLNIVSPGRVDAGQVQELPLSSGEFTSTGDTLVVRGGQGGAEIHVQWMVRPGPGANLAALNAWLTSHSFEETKDGFTWFSARMDTAEVSCQVVPGQWMTAYHEADPNFLGTDCDLDAADPGPNGNTTRLANDIFRDQLFTPGTRLNLFYKARYTGSSTWRIYPDTTGGTYLEMEVLPSSMGADSTFNRVLYVDHADGRGAQPVIESGLSSVLGTGSNSFETTNWDRWDVRAPSSGNVSLARPKGAQFGATLCQLTGYKVILFNSGEVGAFIVSEDDGAVLNEWLTCFPFNNLYLTGDDIALSVVAESANAPSSRFLLENLAGVNFNCSTFHEFECPVGSPQDFTDCVTLDPVGGANVAEATVLRGVTHQGQGNGCPVPRSFDVLGTYMPDFGLAVPDEQYVAAKTADYASISNDAADPGFINAQATYKTVVDGVSVHNRRNAFGCQPNVSNPITAVEERLGEVLTWFGGGGLSNGSTCKALDVISGAVTADCVGPLEGVTVDLLHVSGAFFTTTTAADGSYRFEEFLGRPCANEGEVSISIPLGFLAVSPSNGDTMLVFTGNDTVNFVLACIEVVGKARTIGYWKHQASVYISGKGHAQETEVDMTTTFPNLIFGHFHENALNGIEVEGVTFIDTGGGPEPITLATMQATLTVNQNGTMFDQAKQQYLALLLNLASGKLLPSSIVSDDGASASQALQQVADLINNGDPSDDELAKDICDTINNAQLVAAGVIDLGIETIAYSRPFQLNRIATVLHGAAPNPFLSSTTIRFQLRESGEVRVVVYDITGRLVRSVFDQWAEAGPHEVTWNGVNSQGARVASGIYYIRMVAKDYEATKHAVFVR